MSDNNLTPEAIDAGLDQFAADFLSGSVEDSDSNTGTPNELVTLAEEMLDVGDEPSDQATEADESNSESDTPAETAEESDGDTPAEVEDDVEADDEPTDDEVSEYFEVDYNDAKDGIYPIKINGEVKMMKFSEIQNQLARSESASKKSQEANQLQEQLEERELKLQETETWLSKRVQASEGADELAQIGSHLRQMHAAYEKAAQSQDSHQMQMIKYNIDKASQAYNQKQEQISAVQSEHKERHLNEQYEVLKTKGFGDVITDDFKSYANGNLSEPALQAVNMDATLIVALEKARKWDASQGKAKKTLKKGKTLSAGGGKINQAQNEKQTAVRQAMAKGHGRQEDALTGLDAIANDILFG